MKIQIDHFLNGIWDSKDQAQVSEYQNILSFVIVGMYYNYKFICFWNFEFFYANYLV